MAEERHEMIGVSSIGYCANPVEFEHGGPAPAPAHPFVQPAFGTQADDFFFNRKTAYCGLKKNENRLYAMFTCANLYALAIAGRKLSTT